MINVIVILLGIMTLVGIFAAITICASIDRLGDEVKEVAKNLENMTTLRSSRRV